MRKILAAIAGATFAVAASGAPAAGPPGVAEGVTVSLVLGEGPGPPSDNQVRVHRTDGSASPVRFTAYAAGQWGTNVGSGAIAPGEPDEILTGPGPGPVYGPHVRGFSWAGEANLRVSFFAYGTLRFGVKPAAADLDGDGFDEILAAPGPGNVFGPHVRGFDFDGAVLTPIARVSFYAYATLKLGANVAGGDLDGDRAGEMVTGPGPGPVFAAQVRGFDFDGMQVVSLSRINFHAFPTRQFGAVVAAGDVDGDGRDEIVAAPGPGGALAAECKGFDDAGQGVVVVPGFVVTAFPTLYGARVALGDLRARGRADLVAGAGPDPTADATVRIYGYAAGALEELPGSGFLPFASRFGVTVGTGALGRF